MINVAEAGLWAESLEERRLKAVVTEAPDMS